MSSNYCVVFGCNNSTANTKDIIPKVHFYSFPGKAYEIERRKLWIHFCKRLRGDGKPGWTPAKHARICSQHFVGNEKSNHPLNPGFNPTIFTTNLANTSSSTARHERYKRKLNSTQTADAGILLAGSDSDNDAVSEEAPSAKIKDQETQTNDLEGYSYSLKLFIISFEIEIDPSFSGSRKNNASTQVNHTTQQDASVQFPSSKLVKDASTGSTSRSSVFTGFQGLNETQLRSLASVTHNHFNLLLSLIPVHSSRQLEITNEDKLLMTLIKLKLGIPFSAIAAIFNCHPTTVGRIFSNTVAILATSTHNWILWPSKEEVQHTMPRCFKENYPNCRVIIDCSESKTQSPPEVSQRVEMYSLYKSCFTVKFLVGMTPGGLICFVSKAYGGRASDAFITNDSGFLQFLEPGDQVMADKGFPAIKAVLESQNSELVTPPYAERGCVQFTVEAMEQTYKVAAVRVHVERIINRIKIFNILRNQIPIELMKDIDNILRICCVLANLQPKIIKEDNF